MYSLIIIKHNAMGGWDASYIYRVKMTPTKNKTKNNNNNNIQELLRFLYQYKNKWHDEEEWVESYLYWFWVKHQKSWQIYVFSLFRNFTESSISHMTYCNFDKAPTPFWKMFLSLKQLFDAKNINQKPFIFQCFKIYGNPTNVT